MEVPQNLLEEQFADLLIQLSFISQDLTVTMSIVVQTEFNDKTGTLDVKEAKYYFGR